MTPSPLPCLPAPTHPSLLGSGAPELPHAEPRRIPVVQDNSWKEDKGEPTRAAPGEALESGKLDSPQNLEAGVTGEEQLWLNHRGRYREQLEPNERDPLRLMKTIMAVITQNPFQLHFCYSFLMPPNYLPKEKSLYFTKKETRQGHSEAQGPRRPAGWGWGGTAPGDQATCRPAQWSHSCAQELSMGPGRNKGD